MSTNVATYTELKKSFIAAINNAENYQFGKINWNFVDADLHMDAGEVNKVLPEDYDAIFEEFVSMYQISNYNLIPVS